MSYKNAAQILPSELLRQVQTYADGEFLYIPRLPERKKAWGAATATRRELAHRDKRIYAAYLAGGSAGELSKQFFLSPKSIYRIIGKQEQPPEGPDNGVSGGRKDRNGMDIISLAARPDLIPGAAAWFHEKWKVPVEAYLESMEDSLTAEAGVPAWYVLLDDAREIVAGIGVIANDFHRRPDLTPNLCALYVEEPFRHQGIARRLLDRACADLRAAGVPRAYLITSHTAFYERCGWEFYGMIPEEDGGLIRMYQKDLGAPRE